MLVVISDTSVISNFLLIDGLFVLKSLYNNIIISTAVADEIKDFPDESIDIQSFLEENWVSVREPQNVNLVNQLRNYLDLGEAESIALALELNADYLLIDELLGRKFANENGIKIIGTLGILLLAKKEAIISEIKPIVLKLIARGFWISDSLYYHILELAEENP